MLRHLRPVVVLLGVSGVPHCLAQAPSGRDASQAAPCGSVMACERAYSLRLSSFVPEPNRVSGAILEARINGGPPLRLLLDSGASYITLDARASARSAVSAASESHLVGIGESPARPARSGVAVAVEVGPLRLGNCRIDVAPGRLAQGIDGVIPLSLFGGFLIRLDLPGKVLDLTPYADRAAPTAGYAHAIVKRDLLFMRAALNGALEGYILLDTGASYSAVSHGAAQALRSALVSTVGLRGANGAVDGDLIEAAVQFHVAGWNLTAEPIVALDLAGFSAFNGVETIGVLGYPALRDSMLTVSYRDAMVHLDAPPKGGKGRTSMAEKEEAGAN
jgi:predicted aspartyl protease